MNSRIQQDVDFQLAAKDWTKVDSNGDASVSAFRSTHNQETLETFYDGFSGGEGSACRKRNVSGRLVCELLIWEYWPKCHCGQGQLIAA